MCSGQPSSKLSNHHESDSRVVKLVDNVVRGRKSWKFTKGDTEPIWPPVLEKALIEGLQRYIPTNSRETHLLGRFPMRNRFLSEYILRTTGKLRSPKQVGSRLQQLRDPRAGREMQSLLCHGVNRSNHSTTWSPEHDVPPPQRDAPASSNPPSNLSSTHYEDHFAINDPIAIADTNAYGFPGPSTQRIPITIQILPPGTPWQCFSPGLENESDYAPGEESPVATSSTTLPTPIEVSGASLPCYQPRPLPAIEPTVTLMSQSSLVAISVFSVFLNGETVHECTSGLEVVYSYPTPVACSTGDNVIFYRTALIPSYWNVICDSYDPTQYTIFHDVLPCSDLSTSTVSDVHYAAPIFSVMYKFCYSRKTTS